MEYDGSLTNCLRCDDGEHTWPLQLVKLSLTQSWSPHTAVATFQMKRLAVKRESIAVLQFFFNQID